MTLFNLQTILQKVIDSDLRSHFNISLKESCIQAMTSLLVDYEDNGDIVEASYTVLDRLLRLSATPDHPNV